MLSEFLGHVSFLFLTVYCLSFTFLFQLTYFLWKHFLDDIVSFNADIWCLCCPHDVTYVN